LTPCHAIKVIKISLAVIFPAHSQTAKLGAVALAGDGVDEIVLLTVISCGKDIDHLVLVPFKKIIHLDGVRCVEAYVFRIIAVNGPVDIPGIVDMPVDIYVI
jgi:hypothetical protein